MFTRLAVTCFRFFVTERLLEDHEYVLSAHRDMQSYSRHADVRFIFRKDYRKYEFFHHPQVSVPNSFNIN